MKKIIRPGTQFKSLLRSGKLIDNNSKKGISGQILGAEGLHIARDLAHVKIVFLCQDVGDSVNFKCWACE